MNLGPHEIHVWLAFDRGIDDPALLARWSELLTTDEAARRAKLHFEHDRHQFLVTRAVQRGVLSGYVPGVAPREWSFTSGARGKPALAPAFADCGLHFNIAHTPGLVALAVSRMDGIGVDVENARTRSAPLHLATRYFTAAEAGALAALPAPEQPARFFALWTLKESWLKATGEGLAAGLGNISFDLDDSHRLRTVELVNDDAARWRFWQSAPSPQHALALALRADPLPTEVAVTFHDFAS